MGKKNDLTPRKTAQVKVLLEEDRYSQCEIAARINISQKSVSRIKRSLEFNGDFGPNRVGKCGRKKKIDDRMRRTLKKIVVTDRRKTKKQLAEDLKDYGVTVSTRTIRRTLNSEGLMARRPRKKQKITPSMAKKRLEWARGLKHWTKDDWKKVCFSDESIFQVCSQTSQYVRRRPDEEFNADCVRQTVKHPTQVMVWSIISAKGPGRLYIVEGNMKSVQYLQVLKTKLLPQAKEWFPDGEFVFMQDGAPCHNGKIIKEFFEKEELSVLPWPGNSPDMNPIENMWAIVKQEMRKTNITTKVQLIESLIQVWHRNEEIQNNCSNLIASMPNRLKMLIN